ncbi:MAG: hypothetical protein ACK4K7_10070 [Allosphingosinicella sp.]|uniref:hypothetical protein n=1 Tax=Allosphingosinicella sp. TaxID=2823234 RepID=UPI0039378333
MLETERRAIESLIRSQFAALAWGGGREADWPGFASGFLAGATLYPAARPVRPWTVDGFVRRMQDLAADGALSSFSERPLGMEVLCFGNVAVALAGCEMRENSAATTHDVNAVLLVKSDEDWRIAAQAWDAVRPESPPLQNWRLGSLRTENEERP